MKAACFGFAEGSDASFLPFCHGDFCNDGLCCTDLLVCLAQIPMPNSAHKIRPTEKLPIYSIENGHNFYGRLSPVAFSGANTKMLLFNSSKFYDHHPMPPLLLCDQSQIYLSVICDSGGRTAVLLQSVIAGGSAAGWVC